MRFRGPIAPSIFKTHPLTGEPIEPVGYVAGKPVWPFMGGAPDDDDDDDDDGNSGADDDDKDDKSKKSSDSGADDDKDKVITREEFERLERRMRAADKRADEAEAKIKKAEDEEKGELQKATERAEELEKTVTTLQSEVRTLRLNNAFLTANQHDWHDPEDALDVAQRKGYIEDDIVGDDGKVDKKALKAALDRLAKEKTYLVKSASDDKKDDDDEPDTPSGESAGRRSDNGKDSKGRKAQMQRRFPVLSNR